MKLNPNQSVEEFNKTMTELRKGSEEVVIARRDFLNNLEEELENNTNSHTQTLLNYKKHKKSNNKNRIHIIEQVKSRQGQSINHIDKSSAYGGKFTNINL
jgi:acetyl-CoA carboxylase alpha subunit